MSFFCRHGHLNLNEFWIQNSEVQIFFWAWTEPNKSGQGQNFSLEIKLRISDFHPNEERAKVSHWPLQESVAMDTDDDT